MIGAECAKLSTNGTRVPNYALMGALTAKRCTCTWLQPKAVTRLGRSEDHPNSLGRTTQAVKKMLLDPFEKINIQ